MEDQLNDPIKNIFDNIDKEVAQIIKKQKNCKHEFTKRIVATANYCGEYKSHYETNDLICCDCEKKITLPVFYDDKCECTKNKNEHNQ